MKQADGYKSGCFNLDCPGFVPVERGFALGAAVSNVSTLGGNQYIIPTSIWKVNNYDYHRIVSTNTLYGILKLRINVLYYYRNLVQGTGG